MKVDPRHLKLVLAIIEHGTFNRAAAAIGVSQPALSKSISQLERALGVKVFDRGKRGTELTEAGRIVARGAQNVEAAIDRAQAEIAASLNRAEGPLTIGVTPSVALGLLPRCLGDMAAAQPRTITHIVEGLDGALFPALLRGEIELLIGPIDPLRAPDHSVVELLLAQEPFLLGVPAGHRLAGSGPVDIGQLSQEPWILPSPGSSFYRIVEALFLATGQRLPTDAVVTNNLLMQESLIVSTGRLCLLTPAQLIGRRPRFELLRIAHGPSRTLGIRHLAHTRLSPAAEALIAFLHLAARDVAVLAESFHTPPILP